MPTYQISYKSTNTYEKPIISAVLDYLIIPVTDHRQQLVSSNVITSPEVKYFLATQIRGFDVYRCRLPRRTNSFMFSYAAQVEVQSFNPFDIQLLFIEEEKMLQQSEQFKLENYFFIQQSKHTELPKDIAIPQLMADESGFDFLLRVKSFVKDYITYDLDAADIFRNVPEIIAAKRGVCQDYAHLMIAICRNSGLPARYVSGYLHTVDNVTEATAIHAWVEVLIPGVGWVGVDPTNDLLVNQHYIKIAHGIDHSECSILKGFLQSSGKNTTEYMVTVQDQYQQEQVQQQ